MGNRSAVQMAALVFGAIYLAAGVLGFLPFLGGSFTMTNSRNGFKKEYPSRTKK